ncbi:hypothetical protein [Actinomadura sp. WMMA1423]|uniref:hypothetical protein n=1 Tax=Actinomadura sp. WMMA1423 TaxID=2591108 RepID=UPI0011468D60|nr:hypothetical protein [Actinomadura sp. WMMA1423]
MAAESDVRATAREIRIAEATARGTEWLLARLDAADLRAPSSLAACYKLPLLFGELGLLDEGRAALARLRAQFTREDGHTVDERDASARARWCDLYEDLWVAWGANRLALSDEAAVSYQFCLRHLNPKIRGFASRVAGTPHGEGIYDLRATALAGLVALDIGDAETARTAGTFTLRLLEDQPEPDRGFYLTVDDDGQIIRSRPDMPDRICAVRGDQNNPLYYALGLGMTFPAKLYQQTSEERHLDGARLYGELCMAHGRRILCHHYTGKICWGMSLLHALTGEPSYKVAADQAVGHLLDTQMADGSWWLPTLYSEPEDQPPAVTLDRTAEYTLWLSLAASASSRRNAAEEGER